MCGARCPVAFLSLVAGTFTPALALAQWTYESAGTYEPCGSRFTWDFTTLDAEADARLVDGTCDAFDGCMLLYVDDQPFVASSYTSIYDGRGFQADGTPLAGVNVQRFVYVPESGRDFARFLDVFVNPIDEAQDVTVRYRCNLGSDGEETGYGADGDASFETTDTWIASDDADGTDDPSLAFLVQGVDAPVALDRWLSTPGSGSVDFEFDLTIPAVGTQALLTFVVQADSGASSQDTATWLESMPPEATAGLDRELDDVQNFVAGGVPSLSLGGPYQVAEGGSVELVATWYDVDGDTVTLAWDLDGDGDYETPGERAVFDASNKDGVPTAPPWEVGVQATDGTHTTTRRGVVEIVNVPPALVALPDPRAVVGDEWAPQLAVVDPSPDDTVTMTLLDPHPAGATLSEGGTLSWTPVAEGTETMRVRLADEDGGETIAEIPVEVGTNTPPPIPRLLSPDDGETVGVTRPTFVFGSVSDREDDELVYDVDVRFDPEEDRPPCEDGAEAILVDDVAADASGNTAVEPDDRLCRDRRYVWSVRAYDGHDESEGETRRFEVAADAVDEPTGPGEAPAGCACDQGGGGALGSVGALVMAVLLATRRANGSGMRMHGRRT